MRDPKRIEIILQLVNEIWQQVPDQRFFQLIHNLQGMYSDTHNGAGKIADANEPGLTGYDLFYIEDDLVIEFLQGVNFERSPKSGTVPEVVEEVNSAFHRHYGTTEDEL